MPNLELIGLYEVAELADVSPSAVANWRSRNPDFPRPVVNLKSGPVFRASEVRAWLKRRKEDYDMGKDAVRIGLRLLEFECGVDANIDDMHSAELVDYEASRTAGQAARLAMLIRGQDVIEDEQHLKKVAYRQLGMTPPEYTAAKQLLLEADLLEERTTRLGKHVINEKVQRVVHADNYRRIGELWLTRDYRTPKEEALIDTLDRVIERPTDAETIDALRNLKKPERSAVLELGKNAGIIDSVDEAQRIYYSPLLWDVNPKKLAAFLKQANETAFNKVLHKTRTRPGTDFTSVAEGNAVDPLLSQAISGGILPSYRVKSTGGPRVYGFAPYNGGLLTTDTERTILDKARALVACLRYGSEAATITLIKNPLWILNAITDAHRNYRLKPHSELKLQYGMLIGTLGRIIETDNHRYMFELIPTDDNLRACAIARELLTTGEVMGEKDSGTTAALHLVNGTIQHPLREVKIARRKRPARADELDGLVEHLRAV
jgi:predicted DNA-binding transcriptional regulator AlpA